MSYCDFTNHITERREDLHSIPMLLLVPVYQLGTMSIALRSTFRKPWICFTTGSENRLRRQNVVKYYDDRRLNFEA